MKQTIIFTHFGDSDYLPYVFKIARLYNEKASIVLLGDDSNKDTATSCGIDHMYYKDYMKGDLYRIFSDHYVRISGANYQYKREGVDWLRFVFARWFAIYNYCIEKNITNFWHFDSDTIVCSDLSEHAGVYQEYDNTELCGGSCINGYISNIDIVQKYLLSINEIYTNSKLLSELKFNYESLYIENAFSEMNAYVYFKRKECGNAVNGASIINGRVIDDCVLYNNMLEMELAPFGKTKFIKKIYYDECGRFYGREKNRNNIVRIVALNYSRVPLELYKSTYGIVARMRNKECSINNEVKISDKNTIAKCLWRRYFYKYLFKNKMRYLKYWAKGLASAKG